MKNNKLISVSVIMFTFFFFAEAEEVSINFDGNYKGIKMEKNLEISTQAIKPEFEQKVRILERKTLSDLVSKCSDENKIKFYKSLVFVNGKLASINIESIKKCVSDDDIIFLIGRLAKEVVRNTKCACDVIMKQYQCILPWNGGYCSTSTCKGSCNNRKNDSYLFRDGYIDMEEIFIKVPEGTFQGFCV